MKKFFVLFVAIVLIFSLSCQKQKEKKMNPAEKTESVHSDFKEMGGIKWYTEKNFEKALEKAKEGNRKLFVVFSALWCSPCQQLKHNIFKNEKFKDILGDIIPVYVEQTTKKGNELCKKYKIRAFPTMKILNSDGKEIASTTGATIDMSYYVNWIGMAKKGITYDNIFELIKQKKISFQDATDFAKSLSYWDYDRAIKVFETAFSNLECKDSKIGYSAISEFIGKIITKSYSEKKKIDKEVLKKYDSVIYKQTACLSPAFKNMAVFLWECEKGNVKKQLTRADIILKDFSIDDLISNYYREFGYAVSVYLLNNKDRKAYSLLEKAVKSIKGEKDKEKAKNKLRNFSFTVLTVVKQCANKKSKKDLEKVSDYLWDLYDFYEGTDIREGIGVSRALAILAHYYGINVEKTLTLSRKTILEVVNKDKSELSDRDLKQLYAAIKTSFEIVMKHQGIQKAEQFVKEIIGDGKSFEKFKNKKLVANIFNDICWSFVEKNYSDSYLISLSEKSIKLDRQPEFLDTLANLYAIKGDYKKALELEKEALKMLEDKKASDKQKEPYKKMIEEWSKKIN